MAEDECSEPLAGPPPGARFNVYSLQLVVLGSDEKRLPLFGVEGEVPGVGVLRVAHGCTNRKIGDLDAVSSGTAVAALAERQLSG